MTNNSIENGVWIPLGSDPIKAENKKDLIKAINEEDNLFTFRDSNGRLCWKINDKSKLYYYLDDFNNRYSCIIDDKYNPQPDANYESRLKWR